MDNFVEKKEIDNTLPFRSGTRKISGPMPPKCNHPEHNPPGYMVYVSGFYEHICPACGQRQTFTVNNPTL